MVMVRFFFSTNVNLHVYRRHPCGDRGIRAMEIPLPRNDVCVWDGRGYAKSYTVLTIEVIYIYILYIFI